MLLAGWLMIGIGIAAETEWTLNQALARHEVALEEKGEIVREAFDERVVGFRGMGARP